MDNTQALPADAMAERIVRHFQAEGFVGVTEALVLRIGLKRGARPQIDAAFRQAAEGQLPPPVADYFELRPCGHFSAFRDYATARSSISGDFTATLRQALPAVYFDPAPLVVEDALATGTRYDAMLKLADNIEGHAYAILLNDPDSSLFEYLGTHHGTGWGEIMGDFGNAARSFDSTDEPI